MSQTHFAYWELFPTIDHIVPVTRGGADDESNWVTTSMLRNSAKAHWTLDELGGDFSQPVLRRDGTDSPNGSYAISNTTRGLLGIRTWEGGCGRPRRNLAGLRPCFRSGFAVGAHAGRRVVTTE
ncbi:HNH endonuclease [Rhodococcus sp. NPDC003318]|uniref:HNH endonuclease n=1 Tax=Rhodococcus sp. NPDC003318 TaxID=3364503 RepID=UPI003692C50D